MPQRELPSGAVFCVEDKRRLKLSLSARAAGVTRPLMFVRFGKEGDVYAGHRADLEREGLIYNPDGDFSNPVEEWEFPEEVVAQRGGRVSFHQSGRVNAGHVRRNLSPTLLHAAPNRVARFEFPALRMIRPMEREKGRTLVLDERGEDRGRPWVIEIHSMRDTGLFRYQDRADLRSTVAVTGPPGLDLNLLVLVMLEPPGTPFPSGPRILWNAEPLPPARATGR